LGHRTQKILLSRGQAIKAHAKEILVEPWDDPCTPTLTRDQIGQAGRLLRVCLDTASTSCCAQTMLFGNFSEFFSQDRSTT
jgi:hypothetical protein